MVPISFAEAEKSLQRWHKSSATVRIMLSASDGPIFDGIVTEVDSSPGQIVVAIWLLKEGFSKKLVFRDCAFSGTPSALLAVFSDGVRKLRISEPEEGELSTR